MPSQIPSYEIVAPDTLVHNSFLRFVKFNQKEILARRTDRL